MKTQISDYVSAIPKSPFYKIGDYVRNLGLENKVIYLNIGQPRFDTPEHIRHAAMKAIEDGFTRYTPESGLLELRTAISSKLKRENNLDADPEREIFVTSGAQAGLYVALKTILNPGDEVLIPSPFYPPYYAHTVLLGGKPVIIPYKMKDGFSLEPEDIERSITERTRVLFVHSPNNPTGGVLTEKNLKQIADVAIKHNLVVLSDEPYESILFDHAKHVSISSLPEMKDRTVTLNSVSKTYSMTGWRIGFAVANDEFMKSFLKVHHAINICSNSVAQKAAEAAYNGSHDFLKTWQNEYEQNRKIVSEGIKKSENLRLAFNAMGTFYCFLDIRGLGMSSEAASEFMVREARVVTTPGSGFGDQGEGFLRISFATSSEKLRAALSNIISAVSK
ncbi:MAG: pyridoxal phosphate-dependent aminotransferase [Nitrososphaerota archaeon]|nr:pyridoxal phosphate-dependent aminotransferase [Nitrososphaerota archaeon]